MRSSKGDADFKVTNTISIVAFKQMYIDKIGDPKIKAENVRMFCLGKELKDENFLYSYDIVDEITVQAMFKS